MEAKYTITEALAELKTLDKRIASTKDFILKYAVRQGSTIDPLDDEGGSHVVVPRKMQSIADLLDRKVKLRTAINAANSNTSLTIGSITKTVSEWIIWRRESFSTELDSFRQLQAKVLDARRQCAQADVKLIEDGKQPERVQEASCFISESYISKKIDELVEIESTLDGKLSLVNATTVISA